MHSSRIKTVSIRPTYSVTYKWRVLDVSMDKTERSASLIPRFASPSICLTLSLVSACVDPPKQPPGGVPAGKKFHRNTPKHPTNSVLLQVRRGERSAIFPSITWKREHGCSQGMRKKEHVKREKGRKDA